MPDAPFTKERNLIGEEVVLKNSFSNSSESQSNFLDSAELVLTEDF
tara:strand:- start:433 stop:570 length:138 start_codon:yes stop_codon:yes gene_type:complete